MPSPLFISHGSPGMLITPSPSRDFLAALGESCERPRAVLVVSAHFIAERPTLTSHPRPPTIHDFLGFPGELYRMSYPASGDPMLARTTAERLGEAKLPACLDPQRGLDHGAWSPLKLMYPESDVPVVQLSLIRGGDAADHFRLGEALRGLDDEGVMVLGSGGMTHNLRALDWKGGARPSSPLGWVKEFTDWFADHAAAGDVSALVDYRGQAPNAVQNHPTDEHLLPFFVALGASRSGRGRRIHAATQMRALSMDAYAFE